MDLKDLYSKIFLSAANIETNQEEKIKSNRNKWWWSNRFKTQGGLRLTEEGLDFILSESKLKTYKIEFPTEFCFTPQVLIWLDNFLDSPYYINKRFIIVLKEKSAFELYLFSGDIRKFGFNKALIKRQNQD